MSSHSRLVAGFLLMLSVVFGGVSILNLLVEEPGYADETRLPEALRNVARHAVPASSILLPAAFFISVLSPEATKPNAL